MWSLVFSTCRLPAPDTCALRNCGTNSRCPKDEAGWANCVCLKGFQLLPNASCAHSCAIMVCDPNSSCVKEEDGLAMCVCNWGFAMTPTGCVDTCVLKNRVNSTCSKGAAGNASCACYPDFALHPDGHTCKDTCEIQNCGVNGQCVKDDTGNCGENGQCIKDDITGAAHCECDIGFALQEDGRTCIDTCEIQNCGVNGQCVKDDTGAASCVCDTGFALQEDGKTCIDVCVIKNYTCEVKACVGGTCSQDSTTGAASCHCDADAGLVLLDDDRTCKDTMRGEGVWCKRPVRQGQHQWSGILCL
ncbi:unnamed protein product [Closterium sp. NIES-64]|nr:unnamed protein product [Closterium sp. NIES-64]